MRHGNSEANQMGVISSDPNVATGTHGLSALGVEQVMESVEKFRGMREGATTRVFCSDFKRASMTGDMLAAGIGTIATREVRLRERYFGSLDGGGDTRYGEVWERDGEDDAHEWEGVESVKSVRERTAELVMEIEDDDVKNGREAGDVVLVAHGDVLQILMTVFKGIDGKDHRELHPLETAEIRELDRGDTETINFAN